jgi:hypothetical protein
MIELPSKKDSWNPSDQCSLSPHSIALRKNKKSELSDNIGLSAHSDSGYIKLERRINNMNLESKNLEVKQPEVCAVCEKVIGYFDGFAHLKYHDERVPLCSAECLEKFQKNPRYFYAKFEYVKFVET